MIIDPPRPTWFLGTHGSLLDNWEPLKWAWSFHIETNSKGVGNLYINRGTGAAHSQGN